MHFLAGLDLSGVGEFFDLAFWQQFLITVIGLIVGIPFALALNRWEEQRERRDERRSETARRRQFIQALRSAVDRNRVVLEGMAEAMRPTAIMFHGIDLAFLRATASLKYEMLDSVELGASIDELITRLESVVSKFRIAERLYADGAMRTACFEADPTKPLLDVLVSAVNENILKELRALPTVRRGVTQKLDAALAAV